jgi:hypothetical protein
MMLWESPTTVSDTKRRRTALLHLPFVLLEWVLPLILYLETLYMRDLNLSNFCKMFLTTVLLTALFTSLFLRLYMMGFNKGVMTV